MSESEARRVLEKAWQEGVLFVQRALQDNVPTKGDEDPIALLSEENELRKRFLELQDRRFAAEWNTLWTIMPKKQTILVAALTPGFTLLAFIVGHWTGSATWWISGAFFGLFISLMTLCWTLTYVSAVREKVPSMLSGLIFFMGAPVVVFGASSLVLLFTHLTGEQGKEVGVIGHT